MDDIPIKLENIIAAEASNPWQLGTSYQLGTSLGKSNQLLAMHQVGTDDLATSYLFASQKLFPTVVTRLQQLWSSNQNGRRQFVTMEEKEEGGQEGGVEEMEVEEEDAGMASSCGKGLFRW